MEWKNSRIDAVLEQALVEDRAAGDLTTNLTIDPNLRASASRESLKYLRDWISARRRRRALKW
jgi:hypothetical protein